MNPNQQQQWRNLVLDEVLRAFAAYPDLCDILIFKGARILNLLLGDEGRQSLDLDSNLTVEFTQLVGELERQKEYLEKHITNSLRKHFESAEIVLYELSSVRVERKPPSEHPFGWDGFVVRIGVSDLSKPSTRGTPVVEIDVASPEQLGPDALTRLELGGNEVMAYSLHRIAGEKLRAFLSSLPEYREKIGRRADTRRVKDLADMARIIRSNTLSDREFWKKAADEFRLACMSRYVDCSGLETFAQDIEVTRQLYEQDVTIPQTITFEECWQGIKQVISFFEKFGMFPLKTVLPNTD